MSNYKRKTEDEFTLQGNYGQGWEDLTSASTWKEIRENKKDYQKNEGGTYRITKKRVKIVA